MLITTSARKDATALVEKLDKNTPKGLGLCELTDPSKTVHLSARLVKDITNEIDRKRKCRLIIRNLSFQAVEENIVTKFQKFGPIVEVNIPKVAVTITNSRNKKQSEQNQQDQQQQKLKPRGFGFITFLCANDAEKVVNGGCEGMKICNREFAVDFCLNRHAHEWELKRDEEVKNSDSHEITSTNNNTSNVDEGNDNQENIDESKEDNEDDEDEEGDEEGNENDDNDEENLKEDGDEDDDNENEDGNENVENDENKKNKIEDVTEGRTIFVRYGLF